MPTAPGQGQPPFDRRRQEPIGLVHLAAQVEDVRRGLEPELLDDAKALAVAVFERGLGPARRCPSGWGCTHCEQSLVQRPSYRSIVDAERERQRVTRTRLIDDELERLTGRITVLFEAPALEAGAAICERRDHVLVLDAGFALGRVAHQWTRGGRFDRLGSLFLRRRGETTSFPAGTTAADGASAGAFLGGITSACHSTSVRNARKIARRTRRSMGLAG